MNKCKCGCGEEVKNNYKSGHWAKTNEGRTHMKKVGLSQKGKKHTKEFCENIRLRRIGYHQSDNAKRKLREFRIGKTYEEIYGIEYANRRKKELRRQMLGNKNPMKRLDVKTKHLEACRKDEHRRKISEAVKGEKNGFYGKRHTLGTIKKIYNSSNRRPNGYEQQMIQFFNDNNLPYKYVGNGTYWIGFKNPDFVFSDGKNKVIEFFGEYAHQPEDENKRIEHFKKYNFDTLVIWSKELKDKELMMKKILAFTYDEKS